MKKYTALLTAFFLLFVSTYAFAWGPRGSKGGGYYYAPLTNNLNMSGVGAGTFTRASTATYNLNLATGAYSTAAINTPRFESAGLLMEGAGTNYYPNSGSPATATISLGTGSFTLWMAGASGSIAIAAGTAVGTGWGTATTGNPVTVTITTAGTVVCTVTGSPILAQLENCPVPTSYIPNNGTGSTSRAADGLSWTLTPALKGILSNAYGAGIGTCVVDWTPGLNNTSSTDGAYNVMVATGNNLSSQSILMYRYSFIYTNLGGTNLYVAVNYLSGTMYRAIARWGLNGKFEISFILSGSITNSSSGSENNGFSVSSGFLYLSNSVEFPSHYKNLRIYPTWLSDSQLLALP